MAINFGSFSSILGGLQKIMKLQNVGGAKPIPAPLIIAGANRRSGLSASKIASAIIQRKSEAGLPIGALPSGGVSPDEIMERIRIEEIIKAIQEDAVLTIAIPPGSTVSASGVCAAGPVTVLGSTISITTAYGVLS